MNGNTSMKFFNNSKCIESSFFDRAVTVKSICNYLKSLHQHKSLNFCFTLYLRLLKKKLIGTEHCKKQNEALRKKCPYSEFSGLYFPEFGLNMEIYWVNLRILSKCEKSRTRKNSNTIAFRVVKETLLKNE